jgi:hypothetical protein
MKPRAFRVPQGTLRYWRADLVLWLAEQTNPHLGDHS